MAEIFARSQQTRQRLRSAGAALPYAEGIDPPSMAPVDAPSIIKPPALPAPRGPARVDYGDDIEQRRRLLRKAGASGTIAGGGASAFETYTSDKLG